MKHIVLIIPFLVTLLFQLSAQYDSISLSEEITFSNKTIMDKHLYSNNNGHYILLGRKNKNKKRNNNIPIIQKFDRDLKPVFVNEYIPELDKTFDLNIKYFGGKFAWMFYQINKKNKTYDIFISSISFEGQSSKPKKIVSIKYATKKDLTKLSWHVSQDTSKILFVAEFDKNHKRDLYNAYVTVLDHDFNKTFERRIIIDEFQNKIYTNKWGLSNNGAVHFVGYIINKKGPKKSKDLKHLPNFKTYLYRFRTAKDKLSKFRLGSEDSFLTGLKIFKDQESNLIGAGFLLGSKKRGPIYGTSYFKIDKNDDFIFNQNNDFKEEELDMFGKKAIIHYNNKTGLKPTYKMKELVLKNDNSFDIIIEDNYTIKGGSRTSKNGSNDYVSSVYNSNFIIYTNVNNKGEQGALYVLPKRFKSFGPTCSSHFTLKTANLTYFIYNESFENFFRTNKDPDKHTILGGFRQITSVIAYFKDGQLQVEKLLKVEKQKYYLLTKKGKQIDKNKVFFITQKFGFFKQRYKVGILSF